MIYSLSSDDCYWPFAAIQADRVNNQAWKSATDPEQTFIASDNIAAREGRLTVLKLLPPLDIGLGQAVGSIE